MIALRRQIGDAKTMDDMAKLVGEARGKKYFDKFREQIATFREREEELMKTRQTAANASVVKAKYAMIFGMVSAFMVIRSVLVAKQSTEGANQAAAAAFQQSEKAEMRQNLVGQLKVSHAS